MHRITVAAPAWAIESGIAKEGETQSRLFENNEDYAMEEFRASGVVVEDRLVNADNDVEMFIRGWEG